MKIQENNAQTISRRQLLKSLTAVGGAVALTQIPNKWVSPIVEAGSLPAHAQGSSTFSSPTISNLTVSSSQGACTPGNGGEGQLYTISIDYSDSDGDVSAGRSRVRMEFSYSPSGATDSDEVTIANTNISGSGSNGSISVVACVSSNVGDTSVNISVTLTDETGRRSNNLSTGISL
jgi:hypothetical protein